MTISHLDNNKDILAIKKKLPGRFTLIIPREASSCRIDQVVVLACDFRDFSGSC